MNLEKKGMVRKRGKEKGGERNGGGEQRGEENIGEERRGEGRGEERGEKRGEEERGVEEKREGEERRGERRRGDSLYNNLKYMCAYMHIFIYASICLYCISNISYHFKNIHNHKIKLFNLKDLEFSR